jgi:hypothetical protein
MDDLKKQLNAGRSLVAQLQQEIDQNCRALAALPAKYGYKSAEEFIQAVIAAQPKKTRRQRRIVTIAAVVPPPVAQAPETAKEPMLAPAPATPSLALEQATPPPSPLSADKAPDAVPEQGDLSNTTYHAVLGSALNKTKGKLATAGLPAEAWASWREYERKLRDAFDHFASGPV